MARAYVPMTDDDRQSMLATIGVPSIDELFAAIPPQFRKTNMDQLPAPLSEMEVVALLSEIAAMDVPAGRTAFFRGGGAYRRFTPAVVDEIIRRGEFLTSYTPYQPEASQGTLQVGFEFQSLICGLYGMEVSNLGMYDGGSALAEACLMACRVTQRERVAIAAGVNPRYRRVVETYLSAQGIAIDLDADPTGAGLTDGHACLVLQSPDYYGRVALRDGVIAERTHAAGAVLVVSADPMASALFRPPGELGADIVVGEGQSLGLPLNFGGPYLGLFTTKMEYVRNMPGRIVGQTSDLDGRRAFVLTLQAREQHIRRERAVSNICTNEQLLVLAVTVYLSLMGKQGLLSVARAAYDKAHYLADAVAKLLGWSLAFADTPFFCEFSADAPLPAAEINRRLREQDIVGGIDVSDGGASRILFCTTETNSRAEIDRLIAALGGMRA